MLCRDRCGYCTFAKAPARVTAPYLLPDEVLAIAPAGRHAGCHEALFTLGERPSSAIPSLAIGWPRRVRLDGRLPRRDVSARPGGDRPAPPRQRRRLYREELATLRPLGQPRDDARVAGRGPGGAPGRTGNSAGPKAGHPGGGRRAGHPLHHRDPRRHRRRPAWPAGHLRAIAASDARHGHVQEVIVQNFLPKPGTAMAKAAPCPPGDLQSAIAAARGVLPPTSTCRHPRNLSDVSAPCCMPASTMGGVRP